MIRGLALRGPGAYRTGPTTKGYRYMRYGSRALAGLFSLVVLPCVASAAPPAFDCNKARSGAEELICADAGLADLDRRLSARFAAAVTTVKGLQTGRDAALAGLRATQRGWIKGRDDCWKAGDLRGCVAQSYLTREAELVAQWMLQDPTAIVTYTCDQSPANAVVVYFYDTELPGIRLEYGDSIRTGTLVASASGSKYAMGSGAMFWTKGKAALFTLDEGSEITCTARP